MGAGIGRDHGQPADDVPAAGRAPDRPSRIATLDEVLEAFPGVFLNLDIKQTAPAVRPYEEAGPRTLRAHGRSDDVIVASFNDMATDAFRTFAPEIGTSAGTLAVAGFWHAAHAGEDVPESAAVALQVPVDDGGTSPWSTRSLVEAAHRAGLAVHAWTIDDPVDMARLIELGVDGIMSDVPSVVVGILAESGVRYGGK